MNRFRNFVLLNFIWEVIYCIPLQKFSGHPRYWANPSAKPQKNLKVEGGVFTVHIISRKLDSTIFFQLGTFFTNCILSLSFSVKLFDASCHSLSLSENKHFKMFVYSFLKDVIKQISLTIWI